jgi:hypothetical protein
MRRPVKAHGRNLILGIGDVAKAAGAYSRLGLRVTRPTRRRAVVLLPCGIRLVLTGGAG